MFLTSKFRGEVFQFSLNFPLYFHLAWFTSLSGGPAEQRAGLNQRRPEAPASFALCLEVPIKWWQSLFSNCTLQTRDRLSKLIVIDSTPSPCVL